ncbi:unnamed protein product [Leptidea sinapis]|uniref:Uncharacterized protein n=1 Tax=Leptidea sinapis TaxID=189913 RepID=A0A5E4Q9U1_9NEOP|nr:unnamed protein product [Leptidea sinapis]
MECGRFVTGLRWSAYSYSSSDKTPSITIEDCDNDVQSAVHDNYSISYPDDESDKSYKGSPRNSFDDIKFNYYVNPVTGEVKEELNNVVMDMDECVEDYKFCGAVNDFDIELETEEAVPIVYLSTSRAAKLQRACKLGGLKKVSF